MATTIDGHDFGLNVIKNWFLNDMTQMTFVICEALSISLPLGTKAFFF